MPIENEVENTPIILNRVSTTTQLDGLPAQAEENKNRVKTFGFGATPVSILQQESGKKAERKTLADAITVIEENPKKNYTLFVRDIARLSRDVDVARGIVKQLNNMGVSVFIIDSNLHMTGSDEAYNDKMIFTILAAVAEGGKGAEQLAARTGTDRSRKKGIFSGGIRQSWAGKVATSGPRKGKSLHRVIWEDIPSNENGLSTNKGLARELKISKNVSKDIRAELRRLLELGGEKKVFEYLNFWDAVIAAEKRSGVGSRNRSKSMGGMTQRANALHRVTVAYIQEPMNWPDPNSIGNPDTALPSAPSEATGTIKDAIENFTWYFKKQQ
tara:strand:- start:106 stop:1089 length:984 start_codon:yes stop_codon:yes gene_type:complete